jgi:hypothetical protein
MLALDHFDPVVCALDCLEKWPKVAHEASVFVMLFECENNRNDGVNGDERPDKIHKPMGRLRALVHLSDEVSASRMVHLAKHEVEEVEQHGSGNEYVAKLQECRDLGVLPLGNPAIRIFLEVIRFLRVWHVRLLDVLLQRSLRIFHRRSERCT